MNQVYSRVVNIGQAIYSPANTIHKVLFHPQSKHDSTLVVLSSDSHLRVFELSFSPHVAEQDIPLFPFPKRGYTVDFDIPVPVSFTFGTGSEWTVWTVWTIFILTRDGDIYTLCPIMPTKCVSTRTAVSRMKALISFRRETARLDNTCSLADKETCLNQTRWISDILGQISMTEFMDLTASPAFAAIDTEDVVSFKRPNKVRPTPALQGPVLFQPAPAPMDNILSDANDIVFLNADGIGVVVTTWQGGRVDLGVLVDGVEGAWHVKGASQEELPAVTVAAYESINLPVSSDAWTGILTGDNDDERVFVATGDSLWQIDFRSWLHDLQKIGQNEDDENQSPFQAKRSTTTLISSERLVWLKCH
jgi:nucleoporin NUP82